MAKVNTSVKKVNPIKRFIGNKNTVTILGLIACVAVLVIGYNYRVKVAISPITVPYAKVNIPARTLITTDMVGRLKISSDYVSDATNIVKTVDEVVNKYASYRSNIPRGSLFYKEMLKKSEEMPDSAFANIQDGYTIFSLEVNKESTYANSIRAGDYIDLYMSAQDQADSTKIIFARLIESIRVLAVKDRKGNNILDNSLKSGTPSELLFEVPDEMYELLMIAGYIGKDCKITPVLRNANYTAEANETLVSSEQLKSYILDFATTIE